MSSTQHNNTGSGSSQQSSPTSSGATDSIRNSINDTITRDFSLISFASSTGLDPDIFKNTEHANTTLQRMLSSLENRELCDVILISSTDGKRIPAHRLVLTASSPYFSAMFNSSLREANEREITLHDINSEALELLINYCYTGCVELKEETVEALLATATLLQMTPVVSACSSFLARQLHPSNCIGFALFAELQNCDTLFQLSTSYICQHFTQVVKNQEFFQLDADQLGNMLKNNDLNVATEQEVFHALISWVQHDEENRKKHIPKLLGFIKLPLLQPAFIVDHVEQFCDNSDCMKLVLDAMKYHLLPERYQTVTTERNKPRKSTMGRLMAIGGMDQHKGCITIETYNPRLDKWSLTKNMPTRRLQFGVALMDDKLIIVGGRDGLKTLNTVDLVDLHTMTWTSLNSMGTPRHGLGVAVLEGPLYAVGGHDGWSYLNTVERFDPVSKTWSYIAPMSVMRSTAGVAVLNNRLYVCGGRDGTVCHRSVECYDPHTNRWSMRSPMNKRRGGVAVCALNGFLYALGGHDCPASNPAVSRSETVERYCPSTDTWTIIASLSSGRDAIGCSILGNSIVAVGGYDGVQYLKIVEQYNPDTNEWNQLNGVAYSRAGACVINVPNNLENNCTLASGPAASTTV